MPSPSRVDDLPSAVSSSSSQSSSDDPFFQANFFLNGINVANSYPNELVNSSLQLSFEMERDRCNHGLSYQVAWGQYAPPTSLHQIMIRPQHLPSSSPHLHSQPQCSVSSYDLWPAVSSSSFCSSQCQLDQQDIISSALATLREPINEDEELMQEDLFDYFTASESQYDPLIQQDDLGLSCPIFPATAQEKQRGGVCTSEKADPETKGVEIHLRKPDLVESSTIGAVSLEEGKGIVSLHDLQHQRPFTPPCCLPPAALFPGHDAEPARLKDRLHEESLQRCGGRKGRLQVLEDSDAEDGNKVARFSTEQGGERGSKTCPGDDSAGNKQCRFRPHQSELWDKMYKQLCQYRHEKGDCNVPNVYKPNMILARWVKRQRYQHKLMKEGKETTMTPARVKVLEKIGFVFDFQTTTWNDHLEELKDFRSKHNHCNVPSTYKANPKLATWVKCQRRQFRFLEEGGQSNITPERFRELEKLGFEWRLRHTPKKKARTS